MATCLPCPQGTFLARENHYETRCARCQACDELGEGLPSAGGGGCLRTRLARVFLKAVLTRAQPLGRRPLCPPHATAGHAMWVPAHWSCLRMSVCPAILVTFLSLCPRLWPVMIPTLLSLWGLSCLWCLHLHSPGDLSHLSVGVSGSDSLCSPQPPSPTSPPDGPEELLSSGRHPLWLQARLVHGLHGQPVPAWFPLSLPPMHRLWHPAPAHADTL